MGSHQKIDSDYLLSQLLSGKLTSSEKDKLLENISLSYKDSDLDLLMSEHWKGLDNQEIVVDEMQMLIVKNQILSRINQTQKTRGKVLPIFPVKWGNYLMRVAAVLFIPLLLGSLFTFYFMNKRMNSPEATVMQQIMVTPGSRVHFILPDQSEVWLNSGSSLAFATNMKQQDERIVKLSGEGYFKIAHDKKHPFLVETEKFNVKALGTSFDVSNYVNENQISSTLEEGSIAIIGHNGKELARLHPGQKAILDKSTNTLNVLDVETDQTTSWKDGRLIFRDTPVTEVKRQLERWFNCQIHLDPTLLNMNIKYTATIQDETLGEVLKMMKLSTNSIKTKIVKREVYISKKD